MVSFESKCPRLETAVWIVYGLLHCISCSILPLLYSLQKEYQCFTLTVCPVSQRAVCSSDWNCGDNSYMFVEGLRVGRVGQCAPLQCGVRSCANVVS